MLVELGCIVGGVPLGFALRKRAGVMPVLDTVLTWTVRVLLFLLGLALGGNELLMAQLEILGVRAAVVSLSAVAGSLLAARLLNRVLHVKSEPGDRRKSAPEHEGASAHTKLAEGESA